MSSLSGSPDLGSSLQPTPSFVYRPTRDGSCRNQGLGTRSLELVVRVSGRSLSSTPVEGPGDIGMRGERDLESPLWVTREGRTGVNDIYTGGHPYLGHGHQQRGLSFPFSSLPRSSRP